LAGDECLRNIASLLDAAAKRPEDLAARYGGEEFVLLMPGTGQGGAQYIGGRLRRFVQDLGIAHEGNVNHGVVIVSVGSATAQPGDQSGRFRNVEDLLTAADDAMYRAKHTGRNQIVAAV
jgi:diguanylate cyclase (GGDEF)-like protein